MALKSRVNKAIAQAKESAKESIKLLEGFEKEARTRASKEVSKLLANEKILVRLKSVGVAAANDVSALEKRVMDLESQLAQLTQASKSKKKTATGSEATDAE